jgi:hypothetical protein
MKVQVEAFDGSDQGLLTNLRCVGTWKRRGMRGNIHSLRSAIPSQSLDGDKPRELSVVLEFPKNSGTPRAGDVFRA